MIVDVRSQLAQVPFVPFLIRTSDGHQDVVPTVDHAYITPHGKRVVVATDGDVLAILSPLHISAVTVQLSDG